MICPWTIYQVYGDRRILERHLPAMTRWVEWCRKHSTGLIRDKDRGDDYGDWLSIGADTPKDLIGTAYFAYSTQPRGQVLPGRAARREAAKYERLFEDIKAAFNKRYVTADGRIQGNTQCCYAMALKFDLLPDELRPKAAQYLEDDIKAKGWHLSTGFVGVSYLLPVLTDGGQARHGLPPADAGHVPLVALLGQARRHDDLGALGRLDAGAWVSRPGHELLQSLRPGLLRPMALRHAWPASRLDPARPGFRHILIHPRSGGGLTWARASYRSIRGPIISAWRIDADNTFTLDVTIPPGTTATVALPAGDPQSLVESGKPLKEAAGVRVLRTEGDSLVLEIRSGSYQFKIDLRR